MDVSQTHYFIKIDCSTYTAKCLELHGWLSLKLISSPINLMLNYHCSLNDAVPVPGEDLNKTHFLQHFKIGELIWLMVTCRPDIAFAVIKLLQVSSSPASIHFGAVQHLFQYVTG